MKYIYFTGKPAEVEKEINDWLKSNSVTVVSQTHLYDNLNNNLFVGIFYVTPSVGILYITPSKQ